MNKVDTCEQKDIENEIYGIEMMGEIQFLLVIAWSKELYIKPKKAALFNNSYSTTEIKPF